FDVLWKCLPFFFFTGIGLYCLLTAMVPSWREKNWRHWTIYQPGNGLINPNWWLVQMGFSKPSGEGDFNERTALLVYYGFAAVFSFIGIGGIILTVYRSIA